MSEIDRIKNKGVLPDSFFEDEVRCDYLVESKKKRVWAVSIDLILKLDKVCKKHNLTYFLGYGTLLGAIRHNGFIPWDDDVDIFMLRDDYEKLMSLSHEFEYPYFLQTPYTDDGGYYFSFIKIRNSNTTSLSKNMQHRKYNQGIALDIFCVDNWVDNEESLKKYRRINELIINNSIYMKIGNPAFADDPRVVNYNGADPLATYEEIQTLCRSYKDVDTKIVSAPSIQIYSYDKNIFLKEDFGGVVFRDFEGISLPCPVGFDRILKTLYKDYMNFPPLDKRGVWHSALIDPDKPYTDFFNNIDLN